MKDISGHCYAAVWNDDAVNICQMEKWEMAEEETHEKEKSNAEASEEQEVKECEKRYKVRKIQRKDMVCLPRCEWKHANNSFLVHGYYNYHHLILTVCDGQLKLGVPGVYHPQEAKAAESFGFPEFLPFERPDLRLRKKKRMTERHSDTGAEMSADRKTAQIYKEKYNQMECGNAKYR